MSTHRPIHAANLPTPVGPVLARHGLRASRLRLRPGRDRSSHRPPRRADIATQTEQCLANVRAILEAAGSDLQHVLRCGVFLLDIGEFQQMNAVYSRVFGDHRPGAHDDPGRGAAGRRAARRNRLHRVRAMTRSGACGHQYGRRGTDTAQGRRCLRRRDRAAETSRALRMTRRESCSCRCADRGNRRARAGQEPAPRDWIDPATGHRIVRLTDDRGGSTLYFHDNAFSPEGDKLMFSTPGGIAVVDVAKIGTAGLTPEIVVPNGRGGYFARRSREIVYNAPAPGGGARRRSRHRLQHGHEGRREPIANARGLINADATLSVAKNANAQDPDGKYPQPPVRPIVPQLQRMFPGQDDGGPDAGPAVLRQEGRRAGAARAQSRPAVVHLHQPEDRSGARDRLPVRRPESHAVQPGRSATCCCTATRGPGTSSTAPGRSAPTAARSA